MAPLPSILSSKKESPQHHVTFPTVVPQPVRRPRAVKRWSMPAGLERPPVISLDDPLPLSVDVKPQTDVQDALATPIPLIHNQVLQLSHIVSDSQSSSPISSVLDEEPEPSLSRNSSISFVRKTSITSKVSNVFRNRSKKGKSEDIIHSRSSSVSSSTASTPPCTPPLVVLELKSDPDKGSTSSAEQPPRSGFAQAFKFRPKRASASATMCK